jgi:hypothetical protein
VKIRVPFFVYHALLDTAIYSLAIALVTVLYFAEVAS